MTARPKSTSDSSGSRDRRQSAKTGRAHPADQRERLEELERQMAAARENEKRALADYQNLVRRQQQDRARLVAAASREVIETILEPLEHLNMASRKLNDPGLTMVVDQLWERLDELGLDQLDVLGKEFDERTMEAVERRGHGSWVLAVVRPGFTLGDHVIQHAQVVVGDQAGDQADGQTGERPEEDGQTSNQLGS